MRRWSNKWKTRFVWLNCGWTIEWREWLEVTMTDRQAIEVSEIVKMTTDGGQWSHPWPWVRIPPSLTIHRVKKTLRKRITLFRILTRLRPQILMSRIWSVYLIQFYGSYAALGPPRARAREGRHVFLPHSQRDRSECARNLRFQDYGKYAMIWSHRLPGSLLR